MATEAQRRNEFTSLDLEQKYFFIAQQAKELFRHPDNEYCTRKIGFEHEGKELHMRVKSGGHAQHGYIRLHLWQPFSIPFLENTKNYFRSLLTSGLQERTPHPGWGSLMNEVQYSVWLCRENQHSLRYSFPALAGGFLTYYAHSPDTVGRQLEFLADEGFRNLEFVREELRNNPRRLYDLLGEVKPRTPQTPWMPIQLHKP